MFKTTEYHNNHVTSQLDLAFLPKCSAADCLLGQAFTTLRLHATFVSEFDLFRFVF